MQLRALVTGGAGFVGSHLCGALLARDIFVTCVDNLITGSLRNIERLRDNPAFSLVDHDVIGPWTGTTDVDCIFHLASPASVSDYLAKPLETLQVNSIGTLHMLDLAVATGARFLYTSTSEIYGDPQVHPQPESYWGNVNPTGPRACYSESKRFAEAAIFVYREKYNLDARVVRIFNTYGPHSRPDDGRIVPNFVIQALRHEPLTIYGGGTQTRSYCYVSDLVRGIIAAMFHDATNGEVFNLGNPDEYTVREFADAIARQVGSRAGVVHLDLPLEDPTQRRPDISKAKRLLEWEPEVDLETGLDATIRWFREVLTLHAREA
ncbi:MAG: SDR family oxidoreductase [Chloroflexota bacterium]